MVDDNPPRYSASELEDKLLIPERVAAMTKDLFGQLSRHGRTEQKTIIFCARDRQR